MKTDTNKKFTVEADSSLFSTNPWNPDRYRQLDDNGLAAAFMTLCREMRIPVIEPDTLRYRESQERLNYLADSQHVMAVPCMLGEKWYSRELSPFIGFLRESGQAVVVRKKGFGYVCYDPFVPGFTRITSANAEILSEEGIFIYRIPDQTKRSGVRVLLDSLLTQKREFLIFGLLTLLASFMTMIVPQCVHYITDYLIPSGKGQAVYAAGMSMLLSIAAGVCVNLMVNLSKTRIQSGTGQHMFSGLFARIMEMTSGEEKKLSSRLISFTVPFLSAMDQMMGSALGGVVYLIQCVVVLITIHSYGNVTGIFVYEVLFAAIIAVFVIQWSIYTLTKEQKEMDSKLMICRTELINNMETIKNYGKEEAFYSDFGAIYRRCMDLKTRLSDRWQLLTIILTALNGLGQFALCMYAYKEQDSDLGTFSALLSSFSLLMGYLMSLANSLVDLVQNIPYPEFAREILQTDSEKQAAEGVSDQIKGKIELQDVTFSYSADSRPVISDLNLVVMPGESIGIVGSSGSGKSTLLRLLLGFEKPMSGYVYYDDIRLDQYNLQNLRRQFGVVMQNDSVYSGSIRMNIGMSGDADMEKVKAAAKKAAVADEIEAMPMKYNTLLSSEANVVSGGQKQRIVLARALMNEPRILFLDEASSAMDNISQAVVRQNLDSLGITRINIAHRLSTIENCDRILVMEQGRIVEEGSYEQLMEKKQVFYRMVRRNLI